ncbi:unnamed protein product [Prorocentrum cordatum]|uniref:Fe2OG dioxygenase domain-containing protein n=1 Tax=Prorocentrum cordatum TaxID=2364126 RepID=A0ABN9USH5_9DINO|nr:unnamed protein product [Polarella glacialis]
MWRSGTGAAVPLVATQRLCGCLALRGRPAAPGRRAPRPPGRVADAAGAGRSQRRSQCSRAQGLGAQGGEEFPLIDCGPLFSRRGSDAEVARAITIGTMRDALERRGFFYAAGVRPLPAEYIAEVYEYARKAHALPAAVKAAWVRPRGTYSGADVGDPELAYEKGTTSSARSWDYQRAQTAPYGYPAEDVLAPSFTSFLDALYCKQDELSRALFVAIAEMFGLEADTFSKHCAGDMGTIRLMYYPGFVEGERADAGITAHTDFEALTLMHQDAPGLQLIPRDTGTWVDAPVRPGEFIVIVGDVLERWTNGALRATPHRVVQTLHPRSSIIRFLAVHPETLIEPLPLFVSEACPRRYTPVTMRRHMETTLQQLEQGGGAWDVERNVSLTATREYT